jgi:hypothetical protein
VLYKLHACVPSIRFSISRNLVASEFSSIDASFRRSATSVRFPPRASALFMLILYRSVCARSGVVSFSPPGVHLLIMSIHGLPTVRTFLKTAIVQRVPSVHHSYHDNFLVKSSCTSGPFLLVVTTILHVCGTIRAYPSFSGVGQLV